jgi:hypothetical protein
MSSYSLQAERSPLSKYCTALQIDLADLIGWISHMDVEIEHARNFRTAQRQRQHQFMPNGDWTNPIIHQLLTIRPMHIDDLDPPSPRAIFEEACRLGLLLLLAEIRRRCGVQPTRTAALTEKLAAHLRAYSSTFEECEYPLLLWLLMMGATEMPADHETRGFFLQNMHSVVCEHHIEGWEALLRILRGVLWADEVHTARAKLVHKEMESLFS